MNVAYEIMVFGNDLDEENWHVSMQRPTLQIVSSELPRSDPLLDVSLGLKVVVFGIEFNLWILV